jgi:hypothetical protein
MHSKRTQPRPSPASYSLRKTLQIILEELNKQPLSQETQCLLQLIDARLRNNLELLPIHVSLMAKTTAYTMTWCCFRFRRSLTLSATPTTASKTARCCFRFGRSLTLVPKTTADAVTWRCFALVPCENGGDEVNIMRHGEREGP